MAAGNLRLGGLGAEPNVGERPDGGGDVRGRPGPFPSPPGGVLREFTARPRPDDYCCGVASRPMSAPWATP